MADDLIAMLPEPPDEGSWVKLTPEVFEELLHRSLADLALESLSYHDASMRMLVAKHWPEVVDLVSTKWRNAYAAAEGRAARDLGQLQ
jgi:hypothetical protein